MTSSAERSAPHPGSKLPPPLSPPHVGGGGVQRPLLYRHRYSSFGARSGASPLTRSRGFTPRDRLDDIKRGAERATSRIKLPPPLSPPHAREGESGHRSRQLGCCAWSFFFFSILMRSPAFRERSALK